MANTRLSAPPLVPEVKLHLADESLPLWERTESELDEINLPLPFWAFAWAGGQALARYVIDNPETVAGKRILDLGSGSGLVAIAAMRAGADEVRASDIDAYSQIAASMNAAANSVTLDISIIDLLGTTPDDIDVLLIGDLFYEADTSGRVLAFTQRMSVSGADVFVGDPQRSYFPFERFESVAHYDVCTSREIEDSDIKRADVWRLISNGLEEQQCDEE